MNQNLKILCNILATVLSLVSLLFSFPLPNNKVQKKTRLNFIRKTLSHTLSTPHPLPTGIKTVFLSHCERVPSPCGSRVIMIIELWKRTLGMHFDQSNGENTKITLAAPAASGCASWPSCISLLALQLHSNIHNAHTQSWRKMHRRALNAVGLSFHIHTLCLC